MSPDFDVKRAARITSGFSGADLENVMNEAALLAARRNAEAVSDEDFEEAIERVVRNQGLADMTQQVASLERRGDEIRGDMEQLQYEKEGVRASADDGDDEVDAAWGNHIGDPGGIREAELSFRSAGGRR